VTEIIIAALGGGGLATTIAYVLRAILFRALDDLRKQLVPNGGNSVHDLARKSWEASEATNKRVEILEAKVDALLFSGVQNRG
jgi:hypothetical protein